MLTCKINSHKISSDNFQCFISGDKTILSTFHEKLLTLDLLIYGKQKFGTSFPVLFEQINESKQFLGYFSTKMQILTFIENCYI